jgi:hypothetical protein
VASVQKNAVRGKTMKVAELKDKIKDYKAARLRQLVVEMYKAIPKAVKESQAIDNLIENPDGDRKKSPANSPNIELLRMDVEYFLDNAYHQYYFAPNRVIPRRERPKWRFTALRLFKQLNQAAAKPEDAADAAELLERLYILLCFSCRYVLFSGSDSFASVGVSRPEFLRAVLRAKRQVQNLAEFVQGGILLAVGNDGSCSSFCDRLMEIFVEFLSTPDLKQMAIAGCSAAWDNVRKNGPPCPHRDVAHEKSYGAYDTRTMLRNLATLGFMCHVALSEYEEAVDYFYRRYDEKDSEISLYVLLRLIERYGQRDLWIQTYEDSITRGVRPREELKSSYDARRQISSSATLS